MENKIIRNHTELALRIMHLRAEKFRQEEELTHAIKELAYNLGPVSILKDSLHNLGSDKEVRTDLLKEGLKTGANLIIDKVLGKNKSIKGFFGSLIVEKLTAVFINKKFSIPEK